jgi:hypothetical protein
VYTLLSRPSYPKNVLAGERSRGFDFVSVVFVEALWLKSCWMRACCRLFQRQRSCGGVGVQIGLFGECAADAETETLWRVSGFGVVFIATCCVCPCWM